MQKTDPKSVIYIVDGVSYTANGLPEIKPEEIESIDVLKSDVVANLSCSYVQDKEIILITTKRKSGYIVVRDGEDKKPLASASLVFNECYQVVNRVAGEDGRVYTKGITADRMPVEVSCVGYKSKTVLLDITKNSVHEIELEKDYDTLEQVIIVSYEPIRCRRNVCTYRCGGVVIDCMISTADTSSPVKPTSNYLQVYPNPSRSNASIYLRLPSERGSRLQAELLNASGQLIKTVTLQSSKIQSQRFDLPQLSAGMYYVRITDVDLGKRYVGNLIVE